MLIIRSVALRGFVPTGVALILGACKPKSVSSTIEGNWGTARHVMCFNRDGTFSNYLTTTIRPSSYGGTWEVRGNFLEMTQTNCDGLPCQDFVRSQIVRVSGSELVVIVGSSEVAFSRINDSAPRNDKNRK